MPLQLTDDEMALLTSLAQPIEPAQRSNFLAEVAAAIEAGGLAGGVGPGAVHRIARVVQRRFWTPPEISPAMTAPVHRGASKLASA
jgi:hypothetical protein